MDLDAAKRPLEFCALPSQLTEQLAAVIYRPSVDHRGRLCRHQRCGPQPRPVNILLVLVP